MMKKSLFLLGVLLLVNQTYVYPLTLQVQTYLFISGIIIVGIPHGAADLMIAAKETNDRGYAFSYLKFFYRYLGRLLAFLALILFLPAVGVILFILIASFHFGETDLNKFDTGSNTGKLFSFSYGLVITSVIILSHFDDVKTLLFLFQSGKSHYQLINWVGQYKNMLLSVALVFFFCTVFIYFLGNKNSAEIGGEFLLTFSILVFITYSLPMLLGLTFYFIFWHSILSLKNIVDYLTTDRRFSFFVIITQISFYSFLAIFGIFLFGIAGIMFLNRSTLVIYVILGLAVLTAPHINIMHIMYKNIRLKRQEG
ncbi:Brp/Blh family beta-carotene 15,15'-dioxygenase [Mucilaginibacter sp.]|uniref:Brp/Blh family beta-carotene 15,15'-dioxygenase n=1 Tax=Mucilaginibacter sp. TaxID=1882438 RepID=UPI003D1137EF